MATNTYKSGWTFKYTNADSPETFTALEEATAISGLGEVSELIEVTHFASGGSKEYIAGNLDGSEFTVECNQVNTASSKQEDVRGDKGTTVNVEVEATDGTTAVTLNFAVVVLGYEFNPSPDDVNKVVFTFKISGAITYS